MVAQMALVATLISICLTMNHEIDETKTKNNTDIDIQYSQSIIIFVLYFYFFIKHNLNCKL